jgi:hypothetical protein
VVTGAAAGVVDLVGEAGVVDLVGEAGVVPGIMVTGIVVPGIMVPGIVVAGAGDIFSNTKEGCLFLSEKY